MKSVPKPCLFNKCPDCNIHKIEVIGIAIIKEDGTFSTKEINDPDVDDFWFIVKMYNDGKCGSKHINNQEYKYNHLHNTWFRSNNEMSAYIVHYQLDKYHHIVHSTMGNNGYFVPFGASACKEITILANHPHASQPSLGPKNVTKIKTAIRKYLERVRRG